MPKKLLHLLLVMAVFHFSIAAHAQHRLKTLSRAQLQHYLSRTLDIQGLSDMVRPPSVYYPGTTDRVVSKAAAEQAYLPCSIGARWREEQTSGRDWARYQKMLDLIARLKPAMLLDAVNLWGTWEMDEHLNRVKHLVKDVKAIDPDIVVMGVPNEWINLGIVGNNPIPQYVWDAFEMPNENRPFDCFKMRDSMTEKRQVAGFLGDIRHTETQMYYYWLSTQYIRLGCESISYSAINVTGSPSAYVTEWSRVFRLVRQYADTCNQVRFVMMTAHSANGFTDDRGQLLLDFHIEPMRPTEDPRNGGYLMGANGGACVLELAPQCPTLYQNGKGGLNPNGWYCDRNPGLVFFDNYLAGNQDDPNSEFHFMGQPHRTRGRGKWNCWSPYFFDEISWFALQTKTYRDSFLRYAHRQVRRLDTNLRLALPIRRGVAAGLDQYSDYTCDKGLHYVKKDWWPAHYFALDPDTVLFTTPPTVGNYFFAPPDRSRLPLYGGFGQEAVIAELLGKE